MIPPATRAVIDTSAWPRRPVFDWIQGQGAIAWREMHRTFDCAVGMVAIRYGSAAYPGGQTGTKPRLIISA